MDYRRFVNTLIINNKEGSKKNIKKYNNKNKFDTVWGAPNTEFLIF